MLNYITCTTEELMIHLSKISRQAISQQIAKYEEIDTEVAKKIRNAQRMLKIAKLQREMEE